LIFIAARFRVLPEHADDWPQISRAFTQATRAEEGYLWFDWSRRIDDPHTYVLVEAFRDGMPGPRTSDRSTSSRRSGSFRPIWSRRRAS